MQWPRLVDSGQVSWLLCGAAASHVSMVISILVRATAHQVVTCKSFLDIMHPPDTTQRIQLALLFVAISVTPLGD